jgi:hypothetical protein
MVAALAAILVAHQKIGAMRAGLEIGRETPIQMCEEGSALTQDFLVRGFLRKTWLTKGSGRLMRRISIGLRPPFE